MYCKSVGDPCDPLSFRWPTTKYAATQFWVATHGLRTQAIWQPPSNTGTKLANIKSHIERLIWNEFGLGVISQGEILHWGTGRYLMNWIQVVYIKLKQIWSLFAPAKAKNALVFFFFWMKANLNQNLTLKLAPSDNYFTEELVGISWMELKLFISNWKRFDLYYLPLLKPKNRALFFFFFLNERNSQSKFGLKVSSQW